MVILRFIPAYAGNSMELMTLTKVCSVHPRLRGELKGNKVALPRENGSSPLTRGTHSRKKTDTWSSPVHPRLRGELAYAGNSETRAGLGRVGAVHPRLRGELNRSSR